MSPFFSFNVNDLLKMRVKTEIIYIFSLISLLPTYTRGTPSLLTTKGGPQGQVHEARNLSSSSERPCLIHALRNLQLERPIDSQAIWSSSQQVHD